MSELKYIIKNCPCYIDMPLHNHDKVCRLGDIVKPNHKELYVYCQDCTDCVMKQIVELCKEESSIMQHKQKVKVKGLNKLADRIFELLDIQEVECEKKN